MYFFGGENLTDRILWKSEFCGIVFIVMFAGVYAWIGINFVLGRFNHVEDGKRYCAIFFFRNILNAAQKTFV